MRTCGDALSSRAFVVSPSVSSISLFIHVFSYSPQVIVLCVFCADVFSFCAGHLLLILLILWLRPCLACVKIILTVLLDSCFEQILLTWLVITFTLSTTKTQFIKSQLPDSFIYLLIQVTDSLTCSLTQVTGSFTHSTNNPSYIYTHSTNNVTHLFTHSSNRLAQLFTHSSNSLTYSLTQVTVSPIHSLK